MTALALGRVVALSPHASECQVRGPIPRASLGSIADQRCVDAALTAKRILAEAEASAAARLDEVNQRIARIRDEIRTQVESELGLERAQKLAELSVLRTRIVQRAKEEVVQLAGLLAQRIIGEELQIDPQKQVDLACHVLRNTGGTAQVTLYAAPETAALLSQEHCRLEATTPARIEIVPDPDLNDGDLRIETDVGSIDARVPTQLSHLVAAIVDSLRS